MFLNLNADNMSALELTDYAERYIVDQLATVPGVARVASAAAAGSPMRIWVDRQALAARQLTVTDIEGALRRENVELPAGRLESQTREFSLRTMVGLDTEEDFRALVIGRGAEQPARAARRSRGCEARRRGRAFASCAVERHGSASACRSRRSRRPTRWTSPRACTPASSASSRRLPKGMSLIVNMDNAIAIEAALHEVVIAAGVRVHRRCWSMIYVVPRQLAGDADSGRDHSGLDHRHVHRDVRARLLDQRADAARARAGDRPRRRRRHRGAGEHLPPRGRAARRRVVAAINGSREIGFAVIATTLTLASVFVPISFLPGDIGRLFREFGFTLAASVLFSALIALTLTPMLASKACSSKRSTTASPPWWIDFFKRLEHPLRAPPAQPDARPWLVVAARGGLMAALAA